jgi:hypothetical protein
MITMTVAIMLFVAMACHGVVANSWMGKSILLLVTGIYKFLSLANSGRSCRFEKSSKVMIKT